MPSDVIAEKMPDKLTLRLAPDVRLALEALAKKRGVTLGEIIRHAINMEKFLSDEVESGSKILIKAADGETRQIVFR